MAPLVSELAGETGNPQSVLWWALALGADLGGNATIIGASANVVIVDIARKSGYRITFWQFFKFGFPVMIGSVTLSAIYLWLVFLR
jgi:Na+/H+ antiporter NhaD/arsenite permease-like protein